MTPQSNRITEAGLLQHLVDLQARVDHTEARLEHIVSHDRLYPTPGCEFCSTVRRAA